MATMRTALALLVLAAVPAGAVTVTGIPSLYYTPDTSLAYGACGVLFFRLPGSEPTSRDSYIRPTAIFTLKKQERFNLNGDVYSPHAAWRFTSENRYEKYPSTLWPPPGARNVPKEYYADYTPLMFRTDTKVHRRVAGNAYAGVGAFVEHFRLKDWAERPWYRPGRAYAYGAAGGLVAGPTAFFLYDDRDRRTAASRGRFLQARVSCFGGGTGSDYAFRWYEADARAYFPFELLRHGWTFASRVYVSGRDATPPFWMLPTLGGSALLRGEPDGRGRDRWLVAAQEELRFAITERFLAAAFIDAGDVGYNVTDVSLDTVRLTGGGGLRVDLVKGGDARVRVDYGLGKDSHGLYIILDEAF